MESEIKYMNIKENMNKIFGSLDKGSTVAILIQNPPDPDCLGAAFGFGLLLKEVYGLNSKTFHFGEISHPQNKAMKNVLHIPLEDGNIFDATQVKATVVLDTDLASTGFATDTFTTPDVRIDHHTMDRDPEPRLKDVRPVGSTCSIVWEYLKTFDIDLVSHADVATALIIGVNTDTQQFTSHNVSQLDIEAHSNLLPFANREALARVNNFPLPRECVEMESLAYSNRKERGTTLVSFVGELTSHSRDVISTVASRFARMAGIDTVVIMAVIDNDLQASVRSDDARVDVNDLCVKVFGKKYSGAKEGAGGAKLPLSASFEYIKTDSTRELIIKEIVSNFQNKIFEVLGESDDEAP